MCTPQGEGSSIQRVGRCGKWSQKWLRFPAHGKQTWRAPYTPGENAIWWRIKAPENSWGGIEGESSIYCIFSLGTTLRIRIMKVNKTVCSFT